MTRARRRRTRLIITHSSRFGEGSLCISRHAPNTVKDGRNVRVCALKQEAQKARRFSPGWFVAQRSGACFVTCSGRPWLPCFSAGAGNRL